MKFFSLKRRLIIQRGKSKSLTDSFHLEQRYNMHGTAINWVSSPDACSLQRFLSVVPVLLLKQN